MEKIIFRVRFISPLLLHGGNPRKADPLGLNGKALRGCWRFWFRALVGGADSTIRPNELRELEGKIFGSTERDGGARFRMKLAPIHLPSNGKINLGLKSRPNDFTEGLLEGAEFLVTVMPRYFKDNEQKEWEKIFLSSLWVWGNLGAVGQRARRGFGSPILLPVSGEVNPFQYLGLPLSERFEDINGLIEHLKKGIENVFSNFSNWVNINKKIIPTSKTTLPSYFTFGCLNQVAVGSGSEKNLSNLLKTIHGQLCNALGWGGKEGRMASPIFVRIHKVDNGYVPVGTFCQQKDIEQNCDDHKRGCVNYYCKQSGLTKKLV